MNWFRSSPPPSVPDPDNPDPPMPKVMTPGQRLTTPMGLAAPVQQLTPDQQWFRDMASGRYQADFDVGAHAPVNAMRHADDGSTVDTVRLEPDQDSYLDLGGQGSRDFAAGRP